MRILFAVQGTGNGHLSRARDIYPALSGYGEVDVLISGTQADVSFPYPVAYRLYGMSFIFGSKGGVDIWKTIRKLRLFRMLRDIARVPVHEYDLVINDFEPVTAWACRRRELPCIALSHQAAVLHPDAPLPRHADLLGKLILKYYAPSSAAYGFHFTQFGENIFTPVIRKEIRDQAPVNNGHYTVYLPAYDDETLIRHLTGFRDIEWEVFSKHNKIPRTVDNVRIAPIDNDRFIASMVASEGVLCGAGFEGPAEALHLGKLMVIPMQTQYEQQCNAAGLAAMGVPVISYLGPKYYDRIRSWLMSDSRVTVDYPDLTSGIIHMLMTRHAPAQPALSLA